jgi:predicted RNA-binding protein (virulence factor B family)
VRRFAPPGVYLVEREDDPADEEVLLPRGEVPEGTEVGDRLRAYVHLDSEDRPVATLRTPRLARGEVAFLEVRDVGRFGAFVDWGLTKDLLVPHAEQTRELAVGDRHPIALYLDSSGRLAGTMKIREMLERPGQRRASALPVGSWLEGEAWRKEPEVGVFVILERRFLGLLPAHEPTRLRRGEAARFRVTHVHPDGKIELSMRGLASEELASDGERILAALLRPGTPRLGDRSAPEVIERETGLSKKAFKRAVGRLLKEGRVRLGDDGALDVVRGRG